MEPYTYKFGPRHLAFMKEQIWEARDDLSVYSDLSLFEFSQFERFIGEPRIILEVGCGLGRGSIFLNHVLQNDYALYILADRTGYTGNSGTFAPNSDEFYNDLVLTEDFCRLNGIHNLMTFDTDASDWSKLPRADLIFSLCSFGMHVPIERYIDRLASTLTPEGTMIFGTRHEEYGPHSFSERFAEVLY
jgi:SAM-dependent methyltransferase